MAQFRFVRGFISMSKLRSMLAAAAVAVGELSTDSQYAQAGVVEWDGFDDVRSDRRLPALLHRPGL